MTDERIAEIRERVDADDRIRENVAVWIRRAEADRAFLLSEVDRLRAQVAQLEDDQLRSVERAGEMAEEIERDRATITRVAAAVAAAKAKALHPDRAAVYVSEIEAALSGTAGKAETALEAARRRFSEALDRDGHMAREEVFDL